MQCKTALIFQSNIAEMPWALRELRMPQSKAGMVPFLEDGTVQACCEELRWKLTAGMGLAAVWQSTLVVRRGPRKRKDLKSAEHPKSPERLPIDGCSWTSH